MTQCYISEDTAVSTQHSVIHPSCYIFYVPLMQPGNLCLMAVSMSSSDIQLPRVPLTPTFGVGMASWRSLVHMNVRLSTRATSAGLVRASQLNVEEIEMFLEIICILTCDVNLSKCS